LAIVRIHIVVLPVGILPLADSEPLLLCNLLQHIILSKHSILTPFHPE